MGQESDLLHIAPEKKKRKTRKVTKVNSDGYAIESNVLARGRNVNVESQTTVVARRKADEVSIWEGRVRNAILCQVSPWTNFSDPIFINVRDLMTSDDGDTYDRIAKAARTLISYYKEIHYDDDKDKFTLINFFPYIHYEDGILAVNLNPKLKEHILAQQQQGNYTKIEYSHFRPLTTVAGQWLFEYLASFYNVPSGHTVVSITKLHELLNATPYQVDNFGEFNRRLLKPGLEDIRDHSGWLFFDWKYLRTGRNVTAIDAIFREGKSTEEIVGYDLDINSDENARWAKLSNNCFERHKTEGTICKPGNGKKCRYCVTRGRMYAKKIIDASKQRRMENDVAGQGVVAELES